MRDLVHSEDLTRKLIRSVPLALLMCDRKGSILNVNPQAERLLESGSEALFKREVNTLLLDSPLEFPLANDFASQKFESQLMTKSENIVFVEAEITVLDPEGGAWLISLQDITEKRNIEKFKQNVVNMISHDLRSPLTSLQIFLDLVLEERLGVVPDPVKKQGKVARTSCERLLNMVENLLQVEKLASGSLEINLDDADTASIFESAVSSVYEIANSKGIKISVVGEEMDVVCDSERIVQVLVNFLSNAIKASPNDESIKLTAHREADSIEFCVKDRGPGIPDEEKALVFEKFFQGAKNSKGGFGLGLAICREIVSLHNGTIGVRKNGEQGACFWFRIPAKAQ